MTSRTFLHLYFLSVYALCNIYLDKIINNQGMASMTQLVENETVLKSQHIESEAKDSSIAVKESHVLNGEDAFAQVSSMSDMAYNITTPTGKTLRCRSKYIGMHSNNLLFIESPLVTPQEFAVFFQRGYPIKACAISQKGEGARIYFKSKIEYVVQAGMNSVVIVSLPSATQIDYKLRSEARLEISLEGILEPEERSFFVKSVIFLHKVAKLWSTEMPENTK